jgi:hypothetical protein
MQSTLRKLLESNELKWAFADPDTKQFMEFLESVGDRFVIVPEEEFSRFLDMDKAGILDDISLEQFDENLEEEIECLEQECRELEQRLARKERQEQILEQRMMKVHRESVQLSKLLKLHEQKLAALETPIKSEFARFNKAITAANHQVAATIHAIPSLESISLDMNLLCIHVENWIRHLEQIVVFTRECHQLSIADLPSVDADEFLRLHRALCVEKQRFFDLQCWKAYYSSFEDGEPTPTSLELCELQNQVKESMKIDVNVWWKSTWQSMMDEHILNRQISIQSRALEILNHAISEKETIVDLLDQIEGNMQKESKLLVSYHYALHQVDQLLQSFSAKLNQCAVSKF